MLGFEVDEFEVNTGLWLRLVHPDDQSRVADVIGAAIADGSTFYEIEFRIRHRDGHHVPVVSRAFILRDASGEAIRISGTNTNLTERKEAEGRINQLAFYDPLTSLPNRRLVTEQLCKALAASARSGSQGALLFIDLDNFKMLNDTMGHDKGDDLLQQVAQRLRGCVRGADTVARLGGDEFLVMLEHLPSSPSEAAIEAEQIGQKILAAIARPYFLMEQEHSTTASIGIALFNAGEQGVEGLLKQADLAMYQAKSMGRNTLRHFNVGMQAAVDARLSMENEIRKGLQRNEFVLYYQPQVLTTGTVMSAEVLVRWQHRSRGLVMPGDFIPIAETTGLILPLGKWVLRTACAQLARWACDAHFKGLSLSVNVSVRQFREPDFVDGVLEILIETGADPSKLMLEMTESLFATNTDDIIEKMCRLRAHGVRFSLDDFGTGYSSLRYLQRLPFDELKIDRSFVQELLTTQNNGTIARAIITLAKEFGLDVIAEGVEDEGQRLFLDANGCRAYQGYLFGRPVPLECFEANVRGKNIGRTIPSDRTPLPGESVHGLRASSSARHETGQSGD